MKMYGTILILRKRYWNALIVCLLGNFIGNSSSKILWGPKTALRSKFRTLRASYRTWWTKDCFCCRTDRAPSFTFIFIPRFQIMGTIQQGKHFDFRTARKHLEKRVQMAFLTLLRYGEWLVRSNDDRIPVPGLRCHSRPLETCHHRSYAREP